MTRLGTVFIVLSILTSVFAMAQGKADLGEKTGFYMTDGKPKFGVQMFGDKLSMTFTIDANSLVSNDTVTQITLKFINSNSHENLTPDMIVYSSAPVEMAGTQVLNVSVEQASKLKASLESALLLISVSGSQQVLFSGYIDIAEYCKIAKDHFLNLDTGKTGCKIPVQQQTGKSCSDIQRKQFCESTYDSLRPNIEKSLRCELRCQ